MWNISVHVLTGWVTNGPPIQTRHNPGDLIWSSTPIGTHTFCQAHSPPGPHTNLGTHTFSFCLLPPGPPLIIKIPTIQTLRFACRLAPGHVRSTFTVGMRLYSQLPHVPLRMSMCLSWLIRRTIASQSATWKPTVFRLKGRWVSSSDSWSKIVLTLPDWREQRWRLGLRECGRKAEGGVTWD